MHESHHPHVHGKSWTALLLELAMIGVGVFLGLQVDQWKENRAHREAARTALENFRRELATNRDALAREAPYHRELSTKFRALDGPDGPPRSLDAMFSRVGWHGAGAIAFRHTAWDLALANQSLGYLDPTIAFAVADVYLEQQKFEQYQDIVQRNILTPASLRPDAVGGVAFVLNAFYTDASLSEEPLLGRQYAAVLLRLDTAIAYAGK